MSEQGPGRTRCKSPRSTRSGCTTQDTGDPRRPAAGLRQLARHRLPRLGRASCRTCPAGLRIVRYDMRGHGLSDAPEGDYWMGDLVADAAGLIDHLGLTRRRLRRPLDRRRRRPGPRRRAPRPPARRRPLEHRRQDRHRAELARPHRHGPRRRHRRHRRRGPGALVHPRASTPSRADELAALAAHADPHARRRLLRLLRRPLRHRPARVDRRPPPAGARDRSATTTAPPRPTSCARPPRASPAPASRSSAAPGTSPASSSRRRWRAHRPAS